MAAHLRRSLVAVVAGAAFVMGAVGSTEARVTQITMSAPTPLFNGQTFGSAGAYEQIKGTAKGELDPADRHNVVITDIQFAPKNANGKVEYTTTFTIIKPVDMSKSSGLMMYEVVNRGNHIVPGTLNVAVNNVADPGDGFVYQWGDVLVCSGWQGDQPIGSVSATQEAINVPTATNPDGSSITGKVFGRFVNPAQVNGTNATTLSLPGQTVISGQIYGRAPASLDTTQATLISATSETQSGVKGGVVTIASTDWAFADCRTTPWPGTPDATRICLKNGFDPTLLYQIVYTAKDPLVMGVGMAAMRDVVSFFRRATADDSGTANPIAGKTTWVLGYGISQSGRYSKNFLNLGFNEDESGKIVWDALDADIAGMEGQFNIRWAIPGNIANLYEPGAEGPLWWSDYNDVARGHGTWGLLHRCTGSNTCPLIMETYGGPEYWYSRGSVGIAGTKGTENLPLPSNVRRYWMASTTHGGGAGGFNLASTPVNNQMLLANPNPEKETLRALYFALRNWVMNGTAPPASSFPTVPDGTLVTPTAAAMGWPNIPNTPMPDGVMNSVLDYDLGPNFNYNDNSGVIDNVPPIVKQVIPTLATKVDSDGNDVVGVKSLLLQMPLGTYTNWNPTATGVLKGQEASLAAGYIPFAKTEADRATMTFVATLTGAQETPPNSSTVTGTFNLTLAGTNDISCSGTTTFPPGTIKASHIHIAAAGVAGPVIVPLTVTGSNVTCAANATLTDDQVTALKSNGLYANVHTAAFPNGEIRGQIGAAPGVNTFFDPRPSIEERYPSLWFYYYFAQQKANALVVQRYLLPDDANRLINQLLNNMLASNLLPKMGEFSPGFVPLHELRLDDSSVRLLHSVEPFGE